MEKTKNFVQVTAEQMVQANGLHNYGPLFIASLSPSDITTRVGLTFEQGCDGLDYYDAAYINATVNDKAVPITIIRHRGNPDKTVTVQVPLDELENLDLFEFAKNNLQLSDNEIFWKQETKFNFK